MDLGETLGGGVRFLGWKVGEILSGFDVGMWGILMVCGVEMEGDLRGVVCQKRLWERWWGGVG